MLEKFEVIKSLRLIWTPLLYQTLEQLPEKHRGTSLKTQERCDLSYNQGYRDALTTALKHLDVEEEKAQDELDKMTEAMAPETQQ